MWTDEQFKDITFNCIGGSIKAHKIVLKKSSNKYFETLLAGNLPIKDVYDMTDVKLEHMTALLEDIYSVNRDWVQDTEIVSFQTAFEIFTFGQRFMFKAYRSRALNKFAKIKIQSLSDQEFDLFLLIWSENNISLGYDNLSNPFILSKIYGPNSMVNNESFVQFILRISWDNPHEHDIIMDDRITCEIFAKFFKSPTTLYSNQELMNFVTKGLLHFESACKLFTLKLIGMPFNMKVKELNPVKYEFTMVVIKNESNGGRFNIYLKLQSFDHKVMVLEDSRDISNENTRKVSKLSVEEFLAQFARNSSPFQEVLIMIF
jgi:hypothetical protein